MSIKRQPTFSSMQIARKMVRELQALHMVHYGAKTWEIIERALVELEIAIDDHYHPPDTITMFSDEWDTLPEDLS